MDTGSEHVYRFCYFTKYSPSGIERSTGFASDVIGIDPKTASKIYRPARPT